MALQVVLVNPPYPPECHRHPPYIPLGLAYLGAVLIEAGFKVDLIDAQILGLNNKQIANRLGETKPDLVGVTSTTLLYNSALEMVKLVKEVHPNCVTVMGGCHVTFWDQNVFQDSPYVDVAVRREGERTVLELAKKIERHENPGNLLGITYRNNKDEVHRNPDRPYIEDLNELPRPAYDLFPLEKYKVYDRIEFPLQMSRGCTFNCNFCSAVRMHGRTFRVRNPKKVVDDIEFLINSYGANYVGFIDDNFTLDPLKTMAFLNEMKKRGVRIDWDCQSRVDVVSKELLSNMRAAGCASILFGVESGCEKILKAMGKKVSLEKAKTAFKLTREAGILRFATVVFGSPGETKEDIEKTIKFIHEIDPDQILYSIATPYPGTPLLDLVKKMGWLRVADWNKYDTAHPIFETPELKMDELIRLKEEAYKRFYLRPKRVLRMLLKHNAFGYSEAKTSFAWLLRSLGFKLGRRPSETPT